MRAVPDSPFLEELVEAVRLAKEFEHRAEELLIGVRGGREDLTYSRSAASTIRASLDLTRQLARLRRAPRTGSATSEGGAR